MCSRSRFTHRAPSLQPGTNTAQAPAVGLVLQDVFRAGSNQAAGRGQPENLPVHLTQWCLSCLRSFANPGELSPPFSLSPSPLEAVSYPKGQVTECQQCCSGNPGGHQPTLPRGAGPFLRSSAWPWHCLTQLLLHSLGKKLFSSKFSLHTWTLCPGTHWAVVPRSHRRV